MPRLSEPTEAPGWDAVYPQLKHGPATPEALIVCSAPPKTYKTFTRNSLLLIRPLRAKFDHFGMDSLLVGIIFGIGIGLLLRPLLDWWLIERDRRVGPLRQYDEVSVGFDESEVPTQWK
jgi:hypothetical protein